MYHVRWFNWKRGSMSKWHVLAGSFHNEEGRTACGLSFPRKAATRRQAYTMPADNPDLCLNCKAAVESKPKV